MAAEPEHLYQLGKLRLQCSPPDVEGALGDADALASMKNPNQFSVLNLRGNARFINSRQQKTVPDMLGELGKAGRGAETLDPLARQADSKFAVEATRCFLLLSMLHLERGNYDNSLNRAKAFEDARDYGEDALAACEKIPDTQKQHLYRRLAHEAIGNAAEDLAWLARVVPVKTHFTKALNNFLSAKTVPGSSTSPLMSLGRCYYKIVAESGKKENDRITVPLDASFYNGMSRLDMLKAAKQELTDATKSSLPLEKAEAHFWLGRVLQILPHFSEHQPAEAAQKDLDESEWKAADGELWAAAEIARNKELADNYITVYARFAAEHALLHPGFRPGSGNAMLAERIQTWLTSRPKSSISSPS